MFPLCSVLAQAVTAEQLQAVQEQVQSAQTDVRRLIWLIVIGIIAACGYYGTGKVIAGVVWIRDQFVKLKDDLRPASITPDAESAELPARPTPARSLRQAAAIPSAAGFDSAAQTLLQSITADPSVRSTVMTVEKSDGVYELKFTANGAATNA